MRHLLFAGMPLLIAISLPLPAFCADWWPFKDKEAVPVETAPPVAEEDLSALPGEKRMQFEGECTMQAINRAKEMSADTDAFLTTNRDYVHQCIIHHARMEGLIPAGGAK